MQAGKVSTSNISNTALNLEDQVMGQLNQVLKGKGIELASSAAKVDPSEQLRQSAMIAFQNQGHIFETA